MNVIVVNGGFTARRCQVMDRNDGDRIVFDQTMVGGGRSPCVIATNSAGNGTVMKQHDSGNGTWAGWVQQSFISEGDEVVIG